MFKIGDKVVLKENDPFSSIHNGVGVIQSVVRDIYCVVFEQGYVNRFAYSLAYATINTTLITEAPPLNEKHTPIITIADAYIAASKASQPRYTGQAATWKSEGKCPRCGELGRYSLSVAICSSHGEY